MNFVFTTLKPMPTEPPAVPFYSGTYERAIDAKNRAAVPSGWTSGAGEEFYVIPHPSEGYLMVMPPGEFHATEQRIMASEAGAQEKRQAIRRFFSEAHKVATDKQGRVLVPEGHAGLAELRGEVVFVGAGRRFEIWSKARHQADVHRNTPVYQRVAVEIGL